MRNSSVSAASVNPSDPARPKPQTNVIARNLTQWLRWSVWLMILGGIISWQAQNITAFGLFNDEGAHVMWAKLARHGYPLYDETRAVQSPLFLEGIRLSFNIFGEETLSAGRAFILASFGLLAFGLSWLAYRTSGWVAAFGALICLGLSTPIFRFANTVIAEIPATALAVMSVVALLKVMDSRTDLTGSQNLSGLIWLIISGLLLGMSFIIKALNPVVGIIVVLLLAVDYRRRLARTDTLLSNPATHAFALGRELVVWGIAVIFPLAILPLFYNYQALYEQLIAFRGILRAAIPTPGTQIYNTFELFILAYWGVVILAIRTIFAVVIPMKPTEGLDLRPLWLIWLIASSFLLIWHTPLFPHHLIILLPPLILLAMDTVQRFADALVNIWRMRRFTPESANVMLWPVVITACFNLPMWLNDNQEIAAATTGGREIQAVEMLQAVSLPSDFVMSDSQKLVFVADRLTPPPMGDVAFVAIKAGLQTSENMLALTQAYRAPAVANWSLRLPWLPEYLTWVEANYLARKEWDGNHIIYFVPRQSADFVPSQPLSAQFGEAITLRGSDLVARTDTDLDQISLRVYWQTDRPLAQDYTVFTQLLDSGGQLVVSWDSQPLGGYFPTSQWPADEIVTDLIVLPLSQPLSTGQYRLITGLYLLDTLERLPTDGTDFAVLNTLEIE